ncbi:L-aspartate oxidase [Fusobacterium perfoetens]|uniref:L-aspartate oxidase n=1 Tax=Fusobacterium perfoetens TaxID=852 RepID=UPI001EEECB27|nr:L-aspartate oxidase [Fusobacterium perfoetens]MCF2625123.1 L-aspartate oxidase [Fusobacterium perfoetens]
MEKRYDVIIAGTGVAGCFAALHLPENMKVLMITKGELEESDSFLAQGGICVLRDENDFDSFFEDTMKAGHYKNKKSSVELMINSSRDVINQLLDFNVDFAKENGTLLYTREGAHSKPRILYHDDITGQEITEKLLAAVKERKNIEIKEKTTMIDLITNNNKCYGLIIKEESQDITPVFSDNVILATGGLGGIYENSTNFPHLTGDALAIAEKNGVKLKDVSYIQIHPTTLYSLKKGRRFLVSESVRGEGALLYDKNYERFTDELIPRDKLTEKILAQMKKDNTNHVWLDMRPIIEEGIDIKKRFPNIVKKCIEEGYNPEKECIPVVPAQHYFMGGIDVDENSMTSMENLYAAGETSCNGVHGANRLASNSLLESLVFGEIAAKHICSKENKDFNISSIKVDLEKYKDTEKLFEEYKDIILKEIEKDRALKENE